MWSGKKFIKNKQKIYVVFEKKLKKMEKTFFYKLKNLKNEKSKRKKKFFGKFAPKISAPKWTSNKMGNVMSKRATTKRAMPKWLHQKDVLPA